MSVSLKCIFTFDETDSIASMLIYYIVFMSTCLDHIGQKYFIAVHGEWSGWHPGRVVPFLVVKVSANDTGHVPTALHPSTDTTV